MSPARLVFVTLLIACGPLAAADPAPALPQVSDVCRICFEDGRLVVHSRLSRSGTVTQTEMTVVDLPGRCNVRIDQNRNGTDRPEVFYFINTNAKVSNANMVQTLVQLNGDQLTVHQNFQVDGGWRIVSLVQGANGRPRFGQPAVAAGPAHVTLMVLRSDATDKQNITLRADDWAALRREYPLEVNRYLRPVFKWLRQDSLFGVEPVVAWQVFAEDWRPPVELTGRVDRLVEALGADTYVARTTAAEKLQKEGIPAALYLTRRGRGDLSAEQRFRVEGFLSKYPLIEAFEAARLAVDPDFLLDCLNSDDTTVRRVAMRRLCEVTHRNLDLLDKSDEDRATAVETLRNELVPHSLTEPVFDDGGSRE